MSIIQLTAEERRIRIAQLEQELAELRRQEAEDALKDQQAFLDQCRKLKEQNKSVEAVRIYRTTMGCGLRAAFDAINAL